MESIIELILEELKKNPQLNDSGHEMLLTDLSAMLLDAVRGEFHDFANEKYPAPKMTLYQMLIDLANNTKDGKYDN